MNKRVLSLIVMLAVLSMCLLCSCNSGSGGADISLSESQISLTVGSSASLTATGEGPFTWTSSDNDIASVDRGLVRATAVGTTVITVTDKNGGSCSCNVTVADKEITKLTLNSSTTSLEVGKTIQLTATHTPSDASNVNLTWSSSNESSAVVNSEGFVTGAGEGVANIVCRASNGVEASCTVTVTAAKSNTVATTTTTVDDPPQRQPDDSHYGHFRPGYDYREDDFVFPDSSVRRLTRSEISSVLSSLSGPSVSGSYAQDAINEIYARNGYCFRDATIRNYYEAQSWYYADESFTINDFNDVENYNINLLLEYS